MRSRTLAAWMIGQCVVGALTLTLAEAAEPAKPLPDYTKLDPAELKVVPVAPMKDSKTGFVVGGKNSTDLIRSLTHLNGRAIADLEADMRPKKLSEAGFLGANENLLDVLAADNKYVVEELGLTHQELARHLLILGEIGSKQLLEKQAGAPFLYHGKKYRVQVVAFRGIQKSPFQDGTSTNRDATIHQLENGKQLWYSMLVPQMIERYGFYEGKGTKYRVDPRRIVEVLDFLPLKKK